MATVSEAQLQAVVNEMARRSYQRADAIALQTLEALEIWVQLASDLRSPQRAAAKQQLERWVAVMERARAVASGITVVGPLPEGQDGRTKRTNGG